MIDNMEIPEMSNNPSSSSKKGELIFEISKFEKIIEILK